MFTSKDMDTFHMKTVSSNRKYNKLVEGLRGMSAPCSTDIDLLKQWTPVDQEYADVEMQCHCGTTITDLVHIYNSKTRCTTTVGNVCQKYFNNDEMDRLFNDRKYRRLNGHNRKKCRDCNKNLNSNNESGYCTNCRRAREYKRRDFDEAKNSRMKFGKHKGVRLKDIPDGYLQWMIRQTFFRDYRNYVATFLENKPPEVVFISGDTPDIIIGKEDRRLYPTK